MRSRLILLASCLCFVGQTLAAPSAPAIERLTGWMTGVFSTADQARGDENFRDVTLRLTPIWTDRHDGSWLYTEQSLSDAPDHPYRQHIYQLVAQPDGTISLTVFDLPDAIALTGAWKNPALLAKLNPSDLNAPQGCKIILTAQADGSFKGSTEGKNCPDTLQGAAYMTSEITVSEKLIVTLERGYNASGRQVWGSTHGGYSLKRIE